MDAESNNLVCYICGKLFNNNKQLNKHLYNVHKINSKGDVVPDNKFSCASCDKSFARKITLNYHMHVVHSVSNDLSSILKCDICNYKTVLKWNMKKHKKIHNSRKESPKPLLKCPICTASFKTVVKLRHHKRAVHNIVNIRKGSIRRKCPFCSFVSSKQTRDEIHSHLEKMHNISLIWETHTFENLQLFHEWKEDLEKATNTYFKIVQTQKQYVCRRNGNFIPAGKNIRNIKKIGTCKINAFCPSQIKIKVQPNGHVQAKYLPCHLGHENDLKYIRLTRQEKESIACQLINKTPAKDILTGIRKSLRNSDLKRIHLANSQDIRNVKRSFNLYNEDINEPKSETLLEEEDMLVTNCQETCQIVEGEILYDVPVAVEVVIDSEDTAIRRFEEEVDQFVYYVKVNANSNELMKYAINNIKKAKSTLAAMASTSECDVKEALCTSVPDNSNIEKQKRCTNTRKLNRKSKPRQTIMTDELVEIGLDLHH